MDFILAFMICEFGDNLLPQQDPVG